MKARVLVVEDNADILYEELLILELNGYEGISATNGREALEMMQTLNPLPDIIVSDILMPIMNGYDFYRECASNPKWSKIPFVFLSARSSPEDVRFGKYLGAQDYITKPFKESEFVDRIKSVMKEREIREEIQEGLGTGLIKEQTGKLISKLEKLIARGDRIPSTGATMLLVVFWDDLKGPYVKHVYPVDADLEMELAPVADQLYNLSAGLYGQQQFSGVEGILLRISNLSMDGYLLFDAQEERGKRGGQHIYMIGLLAPNIHYLASIKVKEIFLQISEEIKSGGINSLETYWDQITGLL